MARRLDIDRLKKELHIVSEDEFFLQIAGQVSSRSSTDERKQGAVLVKGGSIIGMGYFDGYPTNMEGKNMGVGAIEMSIASCACLGISTQGATVYTYTFPNDTICKMLFWAGISEIVYVKNRANDSLGQQLCTKVGIKITQVMKS